MIRVHFIMFREAGKSRYTYHVHSHFCKLNSSDKKLTIEFGILLKNT